MPHTYLTPFKAADLQQYESIRRIAESDRIAVARENRRARTLDNLTAWAIQFIVTAGIGLVLALLVIAVIVGINYAQHSDRSFITIVLQAFGRTA